MLALAFLLGLSPAAAQSPEQAWESLTARVRAAPIDLGVRPQRSDVRFPIRAVETLLADPIAQSPVLRQWRAALKPALSSEDSLRFASSLADVAPLPAEPAAVSCPRLPQAMRGTVERLAGGLVAAQALARQAADSLGAETRGQAIDQLGGVALDEENRPLDPALLDRLKDFRQDLMAGAAAAAARAVDHALPTLEKISTDHPTGRWTCGTIAGDVVVVGAQGGEHAEQELTRSLLVIGLGGQSAYRGPAAAARAGQVRAVIDFGQAVIESTGAAAGSGIFGVGLLYLPSGRPANVSAGDFSLGAGFFGAGAAFVKSAGARLSASRFSEGAAAFGTGFLDVLGDSATVSADLASQGFGLTRGAGVFSARGDRGTLRCGLTRADPHEELALTSLCQGVGYGPRAYAAGGVGLADVAGSGWDIASSYFAQGAGYWHGLGALFLTGDGISAQARRYSQGSGVHAAAGALLVLGDGDRLANWGVGPAYGWDLGIGLLDSTGNGDSFQADWSAGRAEFNGRSLVSVSGERNALRLPGLGTSDFRRGAPGYALARVSGRGNRVWQQGLSRPVSGAFDVMATPWGVLRLEGDGSLDPQISSRAVAWPLADRKAAAAEDARSLERLGPRPPAGSAALAWDLLVASRFPFAPLALSQAAQRLLSLPQEAAADLLSSFTPERFDEDLWIRVAFCGLGKGAAGAAADRLEGARGLSRALDLGLMRCQSAATAVPAAYAEIGDEDWRVRKEAAATLGYVLGRQGGSEPGRLSDLQASLALLSGESSPEAFPQALGRKRPSDLLALLGLGPAPTPAQRLEIVSRAGNPFDPAPLDALRAFAGLLQTARDDFQPDFAAELRQSQDLRRMARAALSQAANPAEPDDEVKAAALVSLGGLGEPEDARVMEDSLASPSAAVREAASYGLAELGASAALTVKSGLDSPSPGRRLAAVLAAAQSTDVQVFATLSDALKSPDEATRRLAIAGLSAVQTPLESRRQDLLPALRELAKGDPSASVRATAAVAAAQLAPGTAP